MDTHKLACEVGILGTFHTDCSSFVVRFPGAHTQSVVLLCQVRFLTLNSTRGKLIIAVSS